MGYTQSAAEFAGVGAPETYKDFRSESDKERAKETRLNWREAQRPGFNIPASSVRGGANVGVAGATFFRNIAPINPSLGAAINTPQVPANYPWGAPPIVKPKSPSFSPMQLQGVSGDSSRERMLQAQRTPPAQPKPLVTPLPQPQPVPRPVKGGA